VIQSTKEAGRDSSHLPTAGPLRSDASPLLPAVPQEEVVKIATDISKLDTSVGVLSQRCNSLQEEFLLHQEAIRSGVLQQQSHQSPLGDDLEHSMRSSTLHDPTLLNHPAPVSSLSAPSQHPSSSLTSAPVGERTLQTSGLLQGFHESKLQELQSISMEIKQLQEEINSVKSASSEIFERYHIHLPQAMTERNSTRPPHHRHPLIESLDLTDSPFPRGRGLEQYALNDHRFESMQTDLTELREKVEQIYYLSLSAVSMAQQSQQQQQQQGTDRQTEERKPSPGLSLQHLNFPKKTAKQESNSVLHPRPSVSASSSRKKPSSAVAGQQRPNSSIGVSRAINSSDDLLTPPTISFVDTIEPPLRPPPRQSNTNTAPVVRNLRPKGKPPVSSAPRHTSPLQQQLLLLAGGERGMEENSGVMVLPMDGLRIGESNSSVWERDESLESVNASDDVMNHLPTALLYGSITVRDTVKYDKENQRDDTWYRTFQTPGNSNSAQAAGRNKQQQQGGGDGGYVGSLTEYTGDWKMPPPIVN
jgi:hypothetical protein